MASDEPAAFLTRATWRRVAVTIGALCLYRLGCQIPLPGLDGEALESLQHLPGNTLDRLSIFGLGVIPIFSAMVLVEIAKLAFPALARWEASDARKAARLHRGVQIGALAIAALQGYGVAVGMAGVEGFVAEPDGAYYVEVVATFVAATALLAWLADRITSQGLGDGFWILLIAPYLARTPRLAVGGIELAQQGIVSSSALPAAAGFIAAASLLIVALAKAHDPRDAPVPFSASRRRQGGVAIVDVWPPLLAQTVSGAVVATIAAVGSIELVSFRISIERSQLTFGAPLHILLTGALIAGFSLLRASAPGGVAAKRRPVRLTALAQIAVCCGGEALAPLAKLPFAIDGAWLIVILATALTVMEGVRAGGGRLSDWTGMGYSGR